MQPDFIFFVFETCFTSVVIYSGWKTDTQRIKQKFTIILAMLHGNLQSFSLVGRKNHIFTKVTMLCLDSSESVLAPAVITASLLPGCFDRMNWLSPQIS